MVAPAESSKKLLQEARANVSWLQGREARREKDEAVAHGRELARILHRPPARSATPPRASTRPAAPWRRPQRDQIAGPPGAIASTRVQNAALPRPGAARPRPEAAAAPLPTSGKHLAHRRCQSGHGPATLRAEAAALVLEAEAWETEQQAAVKAVAMRRRATRMRAQARTGTPGEGGDLTARRARSNAPNRHSRKRGCSGRASQASRGQRRSFSSDHRGMNR